MADFEVFLEDEEDILRIFHRYPTEPWSFSKLRAKDFARQINDHSGITLLRLKFLDNDRQKALAWLKTNKLKGLATCKAKELKNIGLRFMASAEDHPHLSTRCPPCDLSVDYDRGLCATLSGAQCILDVEATGTLGKKLYKTFRIDTPIAP